MPTTTSSTDDQVCTLRGNGLGATAVRPGVIAADDGRHLYLYKLTPAGWTRRSLGPVVLTPLPR